MTDEDWNEGDGPRPSWITTQESIEKYGIDPEQNKKIRSKLTRKGRHTDPIRGNGSRSGFMRVWYEDDVKEMAEHK